MANFVDSSESMLIKEFQNGNNQALEELVRRYKDRIYTSIFFLVRDKYLAEDLFQDVFIKIIDTIRNNKYNDEGKFLSWAMRISHNLCVDYFRKVKRTPSVVNSDGKEIFDWLDTQENSHNGSIEKRQTHERIRNLLDYLPEEQREVIVLRHYGNLSFKEIAQLTDCSINTALGRMRYGLINLRKMVSEKQITL